MIPTPEELSRIEGYAYQQAYMAENSDEDGHRCHLAGLAAVRDAVLEGAAQEADNRDLFYSDGDTGGSVDLSEFLRSLKGTDQ